MDDYMSYAAKLDSLSRIHIADVTLGDTRERLTWIRSRNLSVNIVTSEKIVGKKLAAARVIGEFTVEEHEDEIKAVCREYVRRRTTPTLGPCPFRRLEDVDLETDEEIELDRAIEPLFGAPV